MIYWMAFFTDCDGDLWEGIVDILTHCLPEGVSEIVRGWRLSCV